MDIAKQLANRFVLRPTTQPLPIDRSKVGTYEIEIAGRLVEAFVCRRSFTDTDFTDIAWTDEDASKPDVLICKLPGAAGRGERSTLFPGNLLEKTCEVWTWNAPGYGRSVGPATMERIAKSAVEFFGHVLEMRSGPKTQVLVCGNSLGCAVGLYLATQLSVAGLVLRNPPPLVEIITARDAWWNLWRGGRFVASGVPVELDAILNATQISSPILFIESGADTLVPAYAQSLVRDAHPGPQRRILMRDAAHDSPIDDAYREAIAYGLYWLLSSNDKLVDR